MPPTEPTAPATADIGGWPTWARRTTIAVILLGALAVAVWGAQRSDTGNDDNSALDPAVVALFPPDGAQALRQTEIGADLATGFDGRLIINGTEIPEQQMEGARDPATVDPVDLAENGIRPNNRNRVYFKPGPGKVIEEFDTGTVDVTVRYFRDGQPGTGGTASWQIRVD